MGIGDSGILAVGKDLEETTKELIANLVDEDSELISIYYGEEVSEEDAEKFTEEWIFSLADSRSIIMFLL